MKVSRVDTPRCGLGEGAVWDPDKQALFYLDIWGKKIFRYDPSTGETRSWGVPGDVGAMGLREGGGLVIAMKDSLYLLDFESGDCAKLAGPAWTDPGITVNDGAVDRNGRFVFGGCCAGFDNPRPIGGLFVLDPDHRIRQLDSGISQSNSHCFSPDGRTLYCADSFIKTLFAYDYDLQAGEVSNKRAFAETSALAGVPDGSAVDAEGRVWMSVFEAGKVAIFSPDGELADTVDLPARLISSVAFGGPDLDRLYVTTIDPAEFGAEPDENGGYVYVVEDLGTRGVPEPRYRG
jgi:L-arabinonolactonase